MSGHAPGHTAPIATPTPNSGIAGIIGLILVVLAVVGAIMFVKSRPEPKPTTPPATQAAPQQVTQVVKVGQERKLYSFDTTGCTEEFRIGSDASFYPKGGWVTIYPPSPAKSWDDAPGIVTDQEGLYKPRGLYKVCRKDSNSAAHAVDVWQ